MHWRPIFFLLLLLPIGTTVEAQSTFKQSFKHNTAPVTTILGVVQAKDSVIYAVGYRTPSPYGWGSETAMITAIAPDGEVLWSKDFKTAGVPGVNNLTFDEITETPDGNLVMNMFSNKAGPGGAEHAGSGLVKMDKNGVVQWTAYINGNNEIYALNHELADPNPVTGGYFIAGRKSIVVGNTYQHTYYCIQIDAQGNRMTGPANNRYFKPTTGTFNIVSTIVDDQGNWYGVDATIGNKLRWMKIAQGATGPEWLKQLAFPNAGTSFQNGTAGENGKIIWTGIDFNNGGTAVGILMMANADGTIDWVKSYTVPMQDVAFAEVIPTNNGYLIGDYYGLVMEVDHNGEVLWANKYITDPTSGSFFPAISRAIDGGYIAGGDFNYNNELVFHASVIKMDSTGQVKDCCSTPVEVIVASVPVTIENREFISVNDSIPVIPWPVAGTASDITARTLCAPTNFVLNDTVVCTGGCLDISLAQLPVGAKANWTTSSDVTVTPGTGSAQLCFNAPGQETLVLQPQLSDGCLPPPYNLVMEVRDAEEALPFALSDSLFCPGNCTTLLLDSLSTAEILYPGGVATTGNPAQICYPAAGEYTITATQIQAGCLRTNTIPVTVENLIDVMPNAFTPNNDMVNDRFRPLLDCIPEEYLFRIFDRWGNLVFETTDPEGAWDGSFRNTPAPVDAYIWTVQSSDPLKVYKGEVTLLR